MNTAAVKITLSLCDDIVRRCKARAALRGQPLARYVEESLDARLRKKSESPASVGEWLDNLPRVSKSAVEDVEQALAAVDFRAVNGEMWQ